MKPIAWNGCYDLSWKGFITPASFSHPAKMSRGLLERIIAHGFEKGYWQEGSLIGDCFGGVGTTGIIGAYHGLRVVSVELEKKFVSLARRNYALHRSKWKALESPRPVILRGDSRVFHALVGKADAMVSSPPFNQTPGGAKGINVNGYNGRSDIKPDYLGSRTYQGQGGDRSPGNIEILKEGSVSGVISSPPYAHRTEPGRKGNAEREARLHAADRIGSSGHGEGYGETNGQIAALKEGSVDSVVASPPYADTTRGNDACGIDWDKAAPTKKTSGRHQSPGMSASAEYGQSAGQIGALKAGSVDGVVKDLTTFNAKITTSECLHIGARNSGGLIGNKPEIRRSSAMDTSALTAASEKTSTSTTKTTRSKPAANGTTHSRISSPSANDITQCATPNPDRPETTCASSAGAHSSLAAEKSSSAEKMSVVADTSERLRKRTAKGITAQGSVSSAENQGEIGKPNIVRGVEQTYWQAVKFVYESCYQAIRPGGVLVLVVKDFVRSGKRVPLCDDTVRLIEHIGFQMVERVHAMLVKETVHADLFGADTKQTTSRKSFFRRLAEKKGSPAIDYEEVLFARKPL